MFDIIFILVIIGFYLLSLAYITACDRLGKGAKTL